MKEKHVVARIKQCLAIAECSTCPRRKLAAVLFDPVRNVDLGSGYNGPPRGAIGDMCGGHYCLRDGLAKADVDITDCQGVVLGQPGAEDGAGIDDDTVLVRVKFAYLGDKGRFYTMKTAARRFWLSDAKDAVTKLLEEDRPIQSGTRIEIGCHHAEWNVICNAAAGGVSTMGVWLIVLAEPCLVCAKLVHHAGITKVLCVKGGYVGGSAGVEYLVEHGVEVEYVEGPPDPRSVSSMLSVSAELDDERSP